MNITPLNIPEVLLLEPNIFSDERGFFLESYNQNSFDKAVGYPAHFVQDNHSLSRKNVLRGLHYQTQKTQGKLIRVVSGAIFDVAVDLRVRAPTFGHWVGEVLSADNFKQLWIPEGFAHGFLVLSEMAEVLYKTTDYWSPAHERCISWSDETLNIKWPLDNQPILSTKDQQGMLLHEAEMFK